MTPKTTQQGGFWSDFWEHFVFLVILIGLFPCIHDFSLFFIDLGSHIPHMGGTLYERLFVDNDFLFLAAFLVLPIVLYLIVKNEWWGHLIGLLPYLLYGLSYLGVYVLCMGSEKDWELALSIACFISFVYFIIRGTLLSWIFPLFLLMLWLGLSGLHMALFAGFALAIRFLYLLFSQNWETFRELGLGKLIPAFFRSFLLWSPMLLVVAFSWWSNKFVEEQAVEAIYAGSFLKHQPEFQDSAQLDSIQLNRETYAKWEAELKSLAQRDTTAQYNRLNRKQFGELRALEDAMKRLKQIIRLRGDSQRKLNDQYKRQKAAIEARFTPLPIQTRRSRYEPLWNSFSQGKEDMTSNQELRLRRQLKVHLGTRPKNSAIEQDCWDYEAPKRRAFRLFALTKRDFERDLYLSLCDTVEQMKLAALKRIDSLENTVKNAQEELPPAAGDLVRNSLGNAQVKPGKIDMNCASKGFLKRVGCNIGEGAAKLATNAAAEASQAALQDAGDKMADDLEKQVGELLQHAGDDAKQGLYEVDMAIDAKIEESKDITFRTMMSTYRLLILILFVMDLIFFFIVIKSFAYVFARVIFSQKHGNPITLSDSNQAMLKGGILNTGNTYRIPAASFTNFFVSRKYEPSGRAPKISMPQAPKSFLARIGNRAWTMNRVVMEEGRTDVSFNAPGGKEFVEWTLQPGEVVIFRYKNFVAMSEEIKLSTIVSLRITSLLFGRMFFSAAEGPGKLILSTKGKPLVGSDPDTFQSIPESRLLAWQKNAHFHIESELNIFDVFFSGVYLKKQEEDLVVIDSDQLGKSKSGIFKFFRHFLLPV